MLEALKKGVEGIPYNGIVIRVGFSRDLNVAESVKLTTSGGQTRETSLTSCPSVRWIKSGSAGSARGRLGFLEIVRFEVVLFQQVIKIRSIFTGQLGGLTYVSIGHGEHLH